MLVAHDKAWISSRKRCRQSEVKPPFKSLCSRLNDRRLLAGWVRSPTAAFEQSSSLNLDLADCPLWRMLDGRNGHKLPIELQTPRRNCRHMCAGHNQCPTMSMPSRHFDQTRPPEYSGYLKTKSGKVLAFPVFHFWSNFPVDRGNCHLMASRNVWRAWANSACPLSPTSRSLTW